MKLVSFPWLRRARYPGFLGKITLKRPDFFVLMQKVKIQSCITNESLSSSGSTIMKLIRKDFKASHGKVLILQYNIIEKDVFYSKDEVVSTVLNLRQH